MKVKSISGTVTSSILDQFRGPVRVIVVFWDDKDFETFLMAPPTTMISVMRLDDSSCIYVLKEELKDVEVEAS